MVWVDIKLQIEFLLYDLIAYQNVVERIYVIFLLPGASITPKPDVTIFYKLKFVVFCIQ